MGKNEFLAVLRGQMTGRIPTGEVKSQLDYYSAYIDSQVANGIREEQAVEELGDPRLIAKTLIESTNRAAEAAGYDGPYRKSTDSYDDSDGVNTGEFGRSSNGSSYQNSESYGNASGSYGQSQSTGNRSAGNGNATKSSGIGCGGLSIALIIIIFVLLIAAVSLIRFTFWAMPGALIVIGIILLVKYLGRRK